MNVGINTALTWWDIAVNIAVILTPIVIAVGFWFAYKHWRATERQGESARNARMAQIVLSITH